MSWLYRKVYESIGTHEDVKSEILEDGMLGQKTKDLKYNLKIVRGEHLIHASYGSDGSVWDGINRVIIPTFAKQKKFVIGMSMMSFLLLLFPFLNLGYSSLFISDSLSIQTLFISSALSSLLIFISSTIHAKKLFALKMIHGLLAPIGSTIFFLGVVNGLMRATQNSKVIWKKRHIVTGNNFRNED